MPPLLGSNKSQYLHHAQEFPMHDYAAVSPLVRYSFIHLHHVISSYDHTIVHTSLSDDKITRTTPPHAAAAFIDALYAFYDQIQDMKPPSLHLYNVPPYVIREALRIRGLNESKSHAKVNATLIAPVTARSNRAENVIPIIELVVSGCVGDSVRWSYQMRMMAHETPPSSTSSSSSSSSSSLSSSSSSSFKDRLPYHMGKDDQPPKNDHAECVSSVHFDLSSSTFVSSSFAFSKTALNEILSTSLILISVILSVFYVDIEMYRTVIKPIESMVSMVRQLAMNPLTKIQVQPVASQNEILQLQNTLAKIASLIQIGFGEAGAEILARNMLEGELNPMAPGKKVYAIFGFCSIRHFSEATEALKEEIMTFTNRIGEVVHENVHTAGGHANKNIGPAFLLVWKIPKTSIEFSIVTGSNQVPSHMSLTTKNRTLSVIESDTANRQQGRFTIADKALISFLKIQLEMCAGSTAVTMTTRATDDKTNERNFTESSYFSSSSSASSLSFASASSSSLSSRQENMKYTNPMTMMGFGLHVGWAIEGTLNVLLIQRLLCRCLYFIIVGWLDIHLCQ